MEPATWLWIPVTLWAAFAQTLRNAAQRHLTASLGTLGATLVRFLYGLPFAAMWLAGVHTIGGFGLPQPNLTFAGWVSIGAVSQIAATALLLRVMAERNFTLGVAYSKSEIIQVAVFGFVFLGDRIGLLTAAAVALGTVGVLMFSPADRQRPLRAMLTGWTSRTALLGLASGTGFAFSAVGYRGAALSGFTDEHRLVLPEEHDRRDRRRAAAQLDDLCSPVTMDCRGAERRPQVDAELIAHCLLPLCSS